MMFGTPAQQQKYLPEILRGEAMRSVGYSKPPGRLRSRRAAASAVRDGEHWVINGREDLDHDLVGRNTCFSRPEPTRTPSRRTPASACSSSR